MHVILSWPLVYCAKIIQIFLAAFPVNLRPYPEKRATLSGKKTCHLPLKTWAKDPFSELTREFLGVKDANYNFYFCMLSLHQKVLGVLPILCNRLNLCSTRVLLFAMISHDRSFNDDPKRILCVHGLLILSLCVCARLLILTILSQRDVLPSVQSRLRYGQVCLHLDGLGL